jgi:hypothetical protein
MSNCKDPDNTLTITRGTTFVLTGSYSIDNTPTSLIGSTVYFTAKAARYDSDAADTTAIIQKTITDGTAEGKYTITIDPTDTAAVTPASGYYDIKVKNVTNEVYILATGKYKLTGSPTNRSA